MEVLSDLQYFLTCLAEIVGQFGVTVQYGLVWFGFLSGPQL